MAVADDKGDVEDRLSTFYSFSFVTQQLCIECGSRMCDNNN